MSRTLSTVGVLPCRGGAYTPGPGDAHRRETDRAAWAGSTWQAVAMLFRRLFSRGPGQPTPLTRVVALLAAVGLLVITVPVLVPIAAALLDVVSWVVHLL